MTSRVFIDSNILLYAIDKSDVRRRNAARKVLRKLIRHRQGVVSTQVAQEFYSIATRKLGVQPIIARRVLEHFDDFDVVSIDMPIVHEAIDCSILSKISFWDALIICTAKAYGVQEVYSEDLNEGQVIRGVKVSNPLR